MPVITVQDVEEYRTQIDTNGLKLVVAYFSATWCRPCTNMGPIYEQLAERYATQAVFLKLDVDTVQEISITEGVASLPSFVFYQNKVRLDVITGAQPERLEAKLAQHLGIDVQSVPKIHGHVDLKPFIKKDECEVLNECDAHTLDDIFEDNDNYMESSCDNQLIISITFSQVVKLHSIQMKGPSTNGPKIMKVFINQPNTLDFDSATKNTPTQLLEITPDDLAGGFITLKYVKFQSVSNVQLFIETNQDNSDVTRIDKLGLFGTPVTTTNMRDFKKIEGKKAEVNFQ